MRLPDPIAALIGAAPRVPPRFGPYRLPGGPLWEDPAARLVRFDRWTSEPILYVPLPVRRVVRALAGRPVDLAHALGRLTFAVAEADAACRPDGGRREWHSEPADLADPRRRALVLDTIYPDIESSARLIGYRHVFAFDHLTGELP